MTNIFTDTDFEDIIATLIRADDAYYNSSEPEWMTDAEYDRLKKRAFAANPSHPYFSRVGSDVRGGKIKLPYTMGSLDQVYEGEIQGWFSKYNISGKEIVITDKLDGISCMLVYRNGELEIAYSRGNGVEGADITRHVKKISSVPAKLKDDSYTVIRGELIMKNDTFKQKWSSKFKNPRVMVAGTMNRSESVDEQIADIDFVAYEIVATSATIDRTKVKQIARLAEHGFDVVPYEVITASAKIDDTFLTNFLKEVRLASPYELDGIVITANDIEAAQGQRNSVSLNPEHSCKYKVNDESNIVKTTVEDVLWEISKSGYLKPRVKVSPVQLFGTTVTYASGYNAKFIYDNKIGPGAIVTITKAGTVIPEIISVLAPAFRHN